MGAATGTVLLLTAACGQGQLDASGSTTTAGPATTTTAGSATTTTAAPSPEHLEDALARLDEIVHGVMEQTGVPGIAVAVVHGDEVRALRGYGLREEGQAETVDSDTVFQLASLSKSISSTAVAALVGEGVISWDDPVQPHLPGFTLSDEWVGEHVTFADLFSHRSGLPAGAGDDLEIIGYDRSEIIEKLRMQPLRPFRDTFGYANFGLTTAGQAAANAAGLTFEEVMQTRLFDPAGMDSATSRYEDFLSRPNRATIHAMVDGVWAPDFIRDPDAQAPAGGISASVRDLSHWLRLQIGGGNLDGEEIVEESALDETHIPHVVSRIDSVDQPVASYALGWDIEIDPAGRVRWAHSGAFNQGTATRAVIVPEADLGIVVLTNAAPIGAPEAIASEFLDVALDGEVTEDWLEVWGGRFAYLTAANPDLGPRPTDPAAPQADDVYVGTYANEYYGTMEVTVSDDGGLVLVAGPGQVRYELSTWDGDTFVYTPYPEVPKYQAAANFTVGEDGRATTLVLPELNGTGLGTFTRV